MGSYSHPLSIHDGRMAVIRLSIPYFCNAGLAFREVYDLPEGAQFSEIGRKLQSARDAADQILNHTILSAGIKTSRVQATHLKGVLEAVLEKSKTTATLTYEDGVNIHIACQNFWLVFMSELGTVDAYYVTRKGGFDTSILIDNGEFLFPHNLPEKVPSAMFDVKQGTRCLAFELWTASAFHFHRANEAVVHAYFDQVTGKAPRPNQNSVGAYLDELDKLAKGDKQVKSALRDINKLHRNPHIHPDHNIESMHEAIALMNAIHNAIFHMLNAIQSPIPALPSAP